MLSQTTHHTQVGGNYNFLKVILLAKQLNSERNGEVDVNDVVARRVIGIKLTRTVMRLVIRVRCPRPAVVAVQHDDAIRVSIRRRALNSQSSHTIQRAQVDLQVRLVVVVCTHPESYNISPLWAT